MEPIHNIYPSTHDIQPMGHSEYFSYSMGAASSYMGSGGGYYRYQESFPSDNSSGGANDEGPPRYGAYGGDPPGGSLPNGDGGFLLGRPPGSPGPQKPHGLQRSWGPQEHEGPQGVHGPPRSQGPQGCPHGGPGDPNITFSTTSLEMSLTDLNGSRFHLLDVQQVTNQDLHHECS